MVNRLVRLWIELSTFTELFKEEKVADAKEIVLDVLKESDVTYDFIEELGQFFIRSDGLQLEVGKELFTLLKDLYGCAKNL